MKKYGSYKNIRTALLGGEISCVEITQYYLHSIEQRNAELNIFLEVYAQEALAKAIEVDKKVKAGTAGKLAGMIIGLKDVICHADHGLQGGSKILNGFVSQFSATVVERLLAEDAIIIGRQNCDEFGMGSSNENSAFGVVRNPLNTTKVPGGSSGGSAAAVCADMCLVALGSDTGGSVRQPAAFCGIVGMKPTYSRISRWGLVAYASSFDTIGIIGQNVEDVALTLETIAGADNFDSTVSQKPVPTYSSLLTLDQKPKIAYMRQTIDSKGLNPEIKENFLQTIASLKADGFEVEEIEFDLLDYTLPTYYILTTAEASTNLSRYDGVRYGHRSSDAQELEAMYKKTRAEGFGKEVQRRIILGTFVLSAAYYDAYFTKAQKVRRLIQDKVKSIFETYDFVLTPTTPTTAFEIGKYEGETVELYLADLYTVPASVAGVPAMSIPTGKDQKGMPIGTQIIANYFAEDKMLAFAQYLCTKNESVVC